MIKIILLMLGLLLLFIHHYVVFIDLNTQFFIFLAGILLLGVPHGAADLLVAERNAELSKSVFLKKKFLAAYLARLILFAVVLYLFPVAGNIIFILFAAYHFGETDLSQFKTNTIPGKIFVISYGLLILSFILLHHFNEVRSIYQLFESGKKNQVIIDWISENRYSLQSATGMLFFTSAFIYFFNNRQGADIDKGQFLVRLALMLFILFNLPLLLGFTFYFVLWHSLLSLSNILTYLSKDNSYSWKIITKQILFYSFIAIAGIGLFGLTGFMFTSEIAMSGYVIVGLAVLTAPHMGVMYEMYGALRLNRDKAGIVKDSHS